MTTNLKKTLVLFLILLLTLSFGCSKPEESGLENKQPESQSGSINENSIIDGNLLNAQKAYQDEYNKDIEKSKAKKKK